jgi:hypothetical protein
MSRLPPVGRRGFRTWEEACSDLEAIASAPHPLNVALVWHWGAEGQPVAPSGRLTVDRIESGVRLAIDGVEAVGLDAGLFAGAWLSVRYDPYFLSFDMGSRRRFVQVRGLSRHEESMARA